MKTFSAQNDWRCFPRIIVVALLFLVAGCGGDDDDGDSMALGDQSAANGLWTGTIGTNMATAVLKDGFLLGFRVFTAPTGDEDIAYFVDYQVAEGNASLTGEDRAREGLGLQATLSGTGAARTLAGTLGGEALQLTLADNNGDTADQSLIEGTWSDADTWTADIGGLDVFMLTIDARGAFTGMTQTGGCVYTGRAVAEESPPPLYRLTMTLSLCTDMDFNGDYRGYAFFTDGGQNDVLNGLSFKETERLLVYSLGVMERQ